MSGNYFLYKFTFRWTEDMQVAEKRVDIWPHIKLIMNFWERHPKSKIPDSKSYNIVIKAVNDQLTIVKLSLYLRSWYSQALFEEILD